MSNRDMRLTGVNGNRREVPKHEMDLLEKVQDRIEEYCETLLGDMEFDRLTAQRAEHLYLQRLADMGDRELSPRETRLNAHALAKYRKRTHEQVIRLAEVIKAARATAKFQTNIQVNLGDRDYTDDELAEALGVLTDAGLYELEGGDDGEGEDEAVRGEGGPEEGGEGR